jgi:hypothetical protein
MNCGNRQGGQHQRMGCIPVAYVEARTAKSARSRIIADFPEKRSRYDIYVGRVAAFISRSLPRLSSIGGRYL